MTAPRVEFCGEWYDVPESGVLTVGREAVIVIDDNPYLHRHFLAIEEDGGLWWLSNVGSLLGATVTDQAGNVQAWLAPGARLPIVFPELTVLFTAGATTYDFVIHGPSTFYSSTTSHRSRLGGTTLDPVPLTTSQRQLIVALAEPMLLRRKPGMIEIPSSATAANRLGWTTTKFNRKLDNVCDKLTRTGVQGLRGDAADLATNRRARLVEYALATRLVTIDDLPLIDLDRHDDTVDETGSPTH